MAEFGRLVHLAQVEAHEVEYVGGGVKTSGHSEGYLAVRTLQNPQGSTCREHRKDRIPRLT